jgi:hypothetical protein
MTLQLLPPEFLIYEENLLPFLSVRSNLTRHMKREKSEKRREVGAPCKNGQLSAPFERGKNGFFLLSEILSEHIFSFFFLHGSFTKSKAVEFSSE